MNRGDVISRARRRALEIDSNVVSDTMAADAFEEAQRAWCRETRCLPVTLSFTLTVNTQKYGYPYTSVEVTRAQGVAAGDTCTIRGNTYTAIAAGSPASGQFVIGADDPTTASNLAAAINAKDSSVTATTDGYYVITRANNAYVDLNGSSSSAVTLERYGFNETPFFLKEKIGRYEDPGATLPLVVPFLETEELDRQDPGWRVTTTTGPPWAWTIDGERNFWVYPQPSLAGTFMLDGFVTDYPMPMDATLQNSSDWDAQTLKVPDDYMEGLVYGTALIILGVGLEEVAAGGRYALYQKRYDAALQSARQNQPQQRPLVMAQRALRGARRASPWTRVLGHTDPNLIFGDQLG